MIGVPGGEKMKTQEPFPIHLEERIRRVPVQEPWRKTGGDPEGGPTRPEVRRPDTRQLLERMKRVDPDQAKRYRQRSGE